VVALAPRGDFRAQKGDLYAHPSLRPGDNSCNLPRETVECPETGASILRPEQKGTSAHILAQTRACANLSGNRDFRARKSALPRTEKGTSTHKMGGLPRTLLKIYTRHQDVTGLGAVETVDFVQNRCSTWIKGTPSADYFHCALKSAERNKVPDRNPEKPHGELLAPQTPNKESLTAIFTRALRAHSLRPECRSLQTVSREPLRGGTAAL
jgi:hypothetical protein